MKALSRIGLLALLAAGSSTALAENITPKLKFNGFATASGSLLSDDQGGQYMSDINNGYPGLTENASFGLESLAGLQFDYQINDQINVVTQLVAQGRNNYKIEAEWAYIGYQINDSWRARAGRFALPTFMYSDTIHVGQSYPWVRLPAEAYYGVPVTTFNGADLLYRLPLGDWNLNTQLLLGGSDTDSFQLRNARGLNLSLSNDSLTVRAGVIDTELSFPFSCEVSVPGVIPGVSVSGRLDNCPIDIKEARTLFSNAGVLFDDGQWFAAAEFARLTVDGWLNDWNAGYVSVGHYFGKWLPYMLWSKINTFNAQDCTALGGNPLDGSPFCDPRTQYNEQTTNALGLRYALSDNVSLKGQYDYVSGFNGTTGFLKNGPTPPDAFGVLTFSLTAAF